MIGVMESHLFRLPSKASSFVSAFCSNDVFSLPFSTLDGIGLDSSRQFLISRNFRDACVFLQYWKHQKYLSADLYMNAKNSSIFKKEKSRVIGPKLAAIQDAGSVELSVNKDESSVV